MTKSQGQKALDLARAYLHHIYDTGDFVQLRLILDKDLQFEGTYFNYTSADEYLEVFEDGDESLVAFDYEIRHEYCDENSACIIYDLIKPSGKNAMAQVFRAKGGKIATILLIFDGRTFEEEVEDL
ncbi:MAG: hypothetical protein RIC15_11315 [Vicingaceae bacterium]